MPDEARHRRVASHVIGCRNRECKSCVPSCRKSGGHVSWVELSWVELTYRYRRSGSHGSCTRHTTVTHSSKRMKISSHIRQQVYLRNYWIHLVIMRSTRNAVRVSIGPYKPNHTWRPKEHSQFVTCLLWHCYSVLLHWDIHSSHDRMHIPFTQTHWYCFYMFLCHTRHLQGAFTLTFKTC